MILVLREGGQTHTKICPHIHNDRLPPRLGFRPGENWI